MSVLLRVDIQNTTIVGGGNYMPWKEIDRVCSYFLVNAPFSKAFQNKRWDGIVHLYKNGVFPSGLLDVVLSVLEANRIPYEVELLFAWPNKVYPWFIKEGILTRDRHMEAIHAVLLGKRGMVQLPTRFGKTTRVAAGSIAGFGVNTLFIAHQLDLIYDARDIFSSMIEGVGEIGVIGDSQKTFKPLTVACIDSLSQSLDDSTMITYLEKKVKYLIVDETQFYGPGEYKKVVSKCGAPYRLFMSATPERNDGADLEIQAASGSMLYFLKEDNMIEEKYISDVHIEMIPFDHKLTKNASGIEYSAFYDEFIVNNVERNTLIVDELLKLVKAGHPALSIVRRIDHGRILREMLFNRGLRVEFVYGDTDAEQRRIIRKDFNEGAYDVLIGSTIFDTAVDLHRASGLVLAAAGSSKIRAPQRVGRVLSQVMGKVAYVKDIKDLNIKYFEEDAKDRQHVYATRYGEKRVSIRGYEPSELEKLFGINQTKMFDNLIL